MSREIIKYIYKDNLVSCYLLPLLELSKFKFGEHNFVNAYVQADGQLIYVQVKSFEVEDPYHCDHYCCTMTVERRKYIVFTFPEKWKHTFQMFCAGRYTEFTKLAKAMIIQHSGLMWKVPENNDSGRTTSDARLLGMYKDRSEQLRILLADQLGIDPNDLIGQELIDPPKPSEFLGPLTDDSEKRNSP